MKRLPIFLILLAVFPYLAGAQRTYSSQSVLANGNFYKIAVAKEGVYKIDIAFFNALGINSQSIPSASIRLYGNGGGMLPENNAVSRIDDLYENAIQVVDGGDGVLNGSDYFLFYSAGPDAWQKDSLGQRFNFVKNLYSNVCYYYISIGGTGKRIQTSSATGTGIPVSTFDDRIAHEVDTINFLRSGKQWYGEEFSSTPGNTLHRSFTYTFPSIVAGSPLTFRTNIAARSVGAASRFEIRVNGQNLPMINIPAVSGNILEAFAVENQLEAAVPAGQEAVTINYSFIPGTFNAQGWLNWLQVSCRRNLVMTGIRQQPFRDWHSVGAGNTATFSLSGATANAQVWEVTNPLEPLRMNLQGSGNVSFSNDAGRLREYIYISGEEFLVPTVVGKVNNQNLHAPAVVDYIIVTNALLRGEANKLAAFHAQHSGMKVTVATTEEIFNEFASGIPDPAAVRDYVKMFYDRAGADTTKRPKYLLLFGDASFDYKNRVAANTNLVPSYQSINSLDPLATYTSDDFFGLLDDADDINLNSPPGLLDIGIGRIPAATAAEAKLFVEKIIHYHSPATLGSWRNNLTFVADDEDGNLHLNDAELISANAHTANPLYNQYKIYLDAFRQESGSGGSRYPAVNQAIINQMFNGNLVWNYSGHGGSQRLAEEAIFDRDLINQLNNEDKLPLMITATCDFAPFDDPANKSLGESLLVDYKKGAIALTTTTRLVFAFSNRIINNAYLQFALQPDAAGKYRSLGEAIRITKNHTLNASADVVNNRKFTLLGDPAMRLAFPEWKVQVQAVNGLPATAADTLKALEECTITGILTDNNGIQLHSFNGTIYPTVFDKAQPVSTLANDPGSLPTTFNQQTNVVYKGKATVTNGYFSFRFIVPKDINYQLGNGRMSFYAENGSKDANGLFTNFFIGGTGNTAINDEEGPSLKAYLNDEKFVNGGLVNEQPLLIIKLKDSSGINTTGTGIGHDITAILDGDEKNLLVLNDFYEADIDNYKQGTVRFQLPLLQPGPHTLKVKAWDVANNSNETFLEFVVARSENLQLQHVLNYPNPFTNRTSFWFEHNQPGSSLKTLIQIYSVSGKLVHQLQKIVQSDGNRSTEIEWDGCDSYGSRLGRGVYIYRIVVTGADGKRAEKLEKLYIL
ncbi:type IX secretion system sortase PorU [Aridibaculum aurantiacum]|uniref:type IX secretion system sortase PorU n=1 Tax=Aridibaculum aurantiacum TaxID=2810307 RepID=UPI001A972D1F|nr:type IX secretion system sortase PorU [Aridibaculum aurantiacum]